MPVFLLIKGDIKVMADKVKTGGRPRLEIDQEQFEELCSMQCTLTEIAGWFRCSEDTIERWCKRTYRARFAEVFKQKRQIGFVSLRRRSFQMAMEGNTAMMIFLLKNHLHMTDTVKVDVPDETLEKAAILLQDVESVIE